MKSKNVKCFDYSKISSLVVEQFWSKLTNCPNLKEVSKGLRILVSKCYKPYNTKSNDRHNLNVFWKKEMSNKNLTLGTLFKVANNIKNNTPLYHKKLL